MTVTPPEPFRPHFAIGVTGHRLSNETLRANQPEVRAALEQLFQRLSDALAALDRNLAPVRFHSLLVDGVDQIAAEMALDRGWDLVAPLPYGQALNLAINAHPASGEEARALLRGEVVGNGHAAAIRSITARARLLELADRDEQIAELFLSAIDAPDDFAKQRDFEVQSSDQVAIAGRVMLERCDLLVAVWDGKVSNLRGGTGHTVLMALGMGTPVLLIDPAQPLAWSILTSPEELARDCEAFDEKLDAVILSALSQQQEAVGKLAAEKWHARSSRRWGFYRRIEALFGGDPHRFRSLVIDYETPQQIAAAGGAAFIEAARTVPGADEAHLEATSGVVLQHFAWADGISSWLSDAYRSGMCFNFVLAALAVIIGAAYLPWDLSEQKWAFASVELVLLVLIVAITFAGSKKRWHARWFETRRVAEYLRHGPILLMLGVFRPAGRWPRSSEAEWPECFARHCLRSVGLPQAALHKAYLRATVENLLLEHARKQRDYHLGKARRLHRVHHALDRLAETCFALAIISVSLYLLLKLGTVFDVVPASVPDGLSKLFTFLGIAFPTLGANIAGIRFFGDFERFADISEVTAQKLGNLAKRMELLLDGPESRITYLSVSAMAHAIDDIVIDEIENWQAVFGGKHVALPA